MDISTDKLFKTGMIIAFVALITASTSIVVNDIDNMIYNAKKKKLLNVQLEDFKKRCQSDEQV